MNGKVPKRIATILLNSLKGGVVPRTGLGYIAVGREKELNALLNDVNFIEEGGATFRFIVGKYGSGKSFLLQMIRNHVMDKGFVVMDADLSPERRLTGTKGQGLATYRELVRNMSTKTKPDGGALPLILEKWISSIQSDLLMNGNVKVDDPKFSELVEKEIYRVVSQVEGMVHGFDFAKIILTYWNGYKDGDDEKKGAALRWLRGEITTKSECKELLGINIMITDDNWYDYVKLLAVFMVKAGYKGMLLLIDELVNLYKIPMTVARQNNYEKILTMYNDILQGKAEYLGIIMGGTPQCVEDTRRGIFSYEALKSRLEDSRFANDEARDFLAPIIRLKPLTPSEMTILVEKLADIHADLYQYERKVTLDELIHFIQIEFSRVGALTNITPREIIRDFIELLNTLYQYPEKDLLTIIQSDEFQNHSQPFADQDVSDEFASFEL